MNASQSAGNAQPRRERKPEGEGTIDPLDTLRAELERAKAEVEALLKAAGQVALPAATTLVANETLDAAHGFYPVERAEDGVAFCWTGPAPEFSFTLPVDRFAGADLRLDGINFIDFERQKDVRLTADGEAVPLRVARGGIGVIVTGTLSARTGNDPTVLVFTLPMTLTPQGTNDTRQLGLAFFRVTLTARG